MPFCVEYVVATVKGEADVNILSSHTCKFVDFVKKTVTLQQFYL